jgi:nascent polypeptide-associated complex subunit alpha
MIPGMNPRDMAKAMKKLGMKQEEIEASEVIIKAADKDIVIVNPQVSKVNMMGQETFQIMGQVIERVREVTISDEDIKTVVEQTSVSEEEAKLVLKETNGDIAAAIIKLQESS